MGSLTEWQTARKCLESRIRELELQVLEKDKQVQELTSKLNQYQCILHSPNNHNGTGPRKQRTAGISAEPRSLRDIQELDKEQNQFRVYPKPVSSQEIIRSAIKSDDFLKHLSDANINRIVDCMQLVDYKKETVIIKEGDVGSKLFVLEDGHLEVTKEGKKLSNLGPGRVFGELAILYNCRRTASVISLTSSKLWEIQRDVFQGIIMRTELLRQKQCFEFLKRVPKFMKSSDDILYKLADNFEEVHYKFNEIILKQGSVGNAFYIITKGQVRETLRNEEQGRETVLRILGPGDFIGEKALDGKDVRATNITVADPKGADCLVLEKETYTQLVNGLESSQQVTDEEIRSRNGSEVSVVGIESLELSDLTTVATVGIGGFGRVELVQVKNEGSQSFALKKMKKHYIVEMRQQEHIMNEKQIMSEARSDFIVRLHKTYRDEKYLYMLLEPCLGGELWAVLRDRKFFEESYARFYTGCVLEALSYLHTRGIVYRDLKPENLLLDRNGYIKLVDFGFAKKIGTGRKTWTFCGTPEYVAPEIIMNRGHDTGADLWSLGILIFELLEGTPPFAGSDPMQTYNLVLKGIGGANFSKRTSKPAQQIIKKLCKNESSERLGYNSIKDIQKHKWYEGFSFEALRRGTLTAPIIPQIKSSLDTSNFDSYPSDESGPPPDDISGWDKDF